MARPSGTLGASILSRGIRVDPLGGVGRASRGYVLQGVPVAAIVPDPTPLITSALLNTDIREMRFVEVYRSPFWHPDREYTGYAANGLWYTDGELDPTHVPFKASWAEEGEGVETSNRGSQDSFPRRILIILTALEVCIFNADTLAVWLRFTLPRTSPPGRGPFLGLPTTELRSMSFDNGFLVVATEQGLRIANFQMDEAYSLRAFTSKRSLTTGLVNRNEDTYMDGATIAPVLGANNCLRVDTQILSNPSGASKRGYTVCVATNAYGFDGIVLSKPGISLPEVKTTAIARSFTSAWSVYDDSDGDGTSPYLVDAGSNWLGLQVSEGDTLVTDIPSTHTVVEVDQVIPGSRLKLDPELDTSATGAAYVIVRGCPAARIRGDGALYLANGESRISIFEGTDWYEGVTPLFSNLTTTALSVKLNAVVESINDLALTGSGDVYAATSLGIFYAALGTFEDGGVASFRYSSEGVVDEVAEYKILYGSGKSCPAVGVDPETGNVIVSLNSTDETSSVVTEINPNIHHAFRYFDKVGLVKTLVTYRNPSGPPDEVP